MSAILTHRRCQLELECDGRPNGQRCTAQYHGWDVEDLDLWDKVPEDHPVLAAVRERASKFGWTYKDGLDLCRGCSFKAAAEMRSVNGRGGVR